MEFDALTRDIPTLRVQVAGDLYSVDVFDFEHLAKVHEVGMQAAEKQLSAREVISAQLATALRIEEANLAHVDLRVLRVVLAVIVRQSTEAQAALEREQRAHEVGFIAQYFPGQFSGAELFTMPEGERRFWVGQAKRARARALMDGAKAAAVPYQAADDSETFFASLLEDMDLYAGDRGMRRRAQEKMWAAARQRLKAEL